MTSIRDQRQQRTVAMTGTVCDAGCNRNCCVRSSDTGDATADHTRTPPRSRPRRHARRSLPSTSSIMEVLYPSSYLGTPQAFPDPPSYFSRDTQPSAVTGDVRGCTSSATTTEGGTLVPSSRPDPLVEAPSLTGVPSPGALSVRNQPAEPSAPITGLGIDILEEAEPPPAYSRFADSSRPPVASDVLGPYPPIPVLNSPA